ncbi:MAG: hypothetical protein GY768_17155 [Planctomycetaceae bacterium]|nr:hypothetical protein [Planctomycetaceae bacterium]
MRILFLTLILFGLSTVTASAQTLRFRQNNTALPQFGGYAPGAGATIMISPQLPITVRQGSSSRALPQFGGFVPGSGARLSFPASSAAAQRAQQRAIQNNQAVAQARQREEAADAIARQAVRDQRRERAANDLLQKAKLAERKGNRRLAIKYYYRAMRRDSPVVNSIAQERLNQLGADPK